MRFMKLTSISLALVALLAASVTSIDRNSKSSPSADASIVGYISDSSCGLKHMSGMGDRRISGDKRPSK